MDDIKCAAERKAEAMADECGHGDGSPYRSAAMLGTMKVCARSMEFALSQIASGKLSADAARKLAKSTLDDMGVDT